MWVFLRHPWFLAVALLLAAAPARAWVETTVQSDVATVQVDGDGSAVVRHEILLRVRGGPLRQYVLEGVDADAEPLPDAAVTSMATGGQPARTPLRLERQDDAGMRIEIDHPKGLRRGTYLFELGYRTNLIKRDLLTSRGGGWAELRWVGPRFVDGIDSLRVVFRLPRGTEAPFVPEADAEASGASAAFGGLFLSNLRRDGAHDELEVVRPHAAKGEPVVWRVMTSSQSFAAFGAMPPETQVGTRPERLKRPAWLWLGFGGFAIALLYALLVVLKARAVLAACALRHAEPRALVPLPLLARATLAGAMLAAAAAIAWLAEQPIWAAAAFAACLALAAERAPRPRARLRGPGQWLPLRSEDAFERRSPPLPVRFFDPTTWPGASIALASTIATAVLAIYVKQRSPHAALLIFVGAGCLVPLFATAGRWALPPDTVDAPRSLLRWVFRRLSKDPALRVTAWGRIPDGSVEPDELRLLVLPRSARPGLAGIEVASEYVFGAGGPVGMPCVVVRATDGSESHAALPRNVVWTRGRKPEERVALLRPEPATRRATLAMVHELACVLSRPGERHKSAAKSAGKRSSTAKAPKVASPAHAT